MAINDAPREFVWTYILRARLIIVWANAFYNAERASVNMYLER